MKLWLNRALNFMLWLAITVMLATGFIIRYRLPPGSRGGQGLSLWGWTRHDWGDLHIVCAYTLCTLVALHLLLHVQWLWHTAFPRAKWLVMAGLVGGLLLALSVWFLPVVQSGGGAHGGTGQGQGAGWHGGRGIGR